MNSSIGNSGQPYNSIVEDYIDCQEYIQENKNLMRSEVKIQEENFHNKKKRVIVILLVLSIVVGCALGVTVFSHEVKGLHTVCYVTNTGECYHSRGCGYLKSVNKTNVYSAIKRGYRACSRCSVGPLDISTKYEISTGVVVCLVASSILCVVVCSKIEKSKAEAIETINKKYNIHDKVELYLEEYNDVIKKNGTLNIINAPQKAVFQGGYIIIPNEENYRFCSQFGHYYHSKNTCSGGYYTKIYRYDIPSSILPCSKCAVEIGDIPEWYIKYKKLNQIKDYYMKQLGH